MKFIRDNIVKIILVFGVLIVLIVVLIACSGGGSTVGKAGSYARMEENFKKATTRFLNNRPDLLPKEEGKIVRIQMDAVYTEKQMKNITVVDDSSVRCDGYANVSYRLNSDDEKVYRVVPHIKCGDKYETEDLYVHILKTEELSNGQDGLYKVGEDYIFKGQNPNNYLKIGENLYRILSIDSEGYIKLISADKLYLSSIWDNRYNVKTGKYSGINDYSVSRIRDAIVDYYYDDTEYYKSTDRSVFVKHSYCVGKRSKDNRLITNTEECSETMDDDYVSLPLIYDYFIASTDENCKTIDDLACNNYNYLTSYRTFYTSTGTAEHSDLVYAVGENVITSKLDRDRKVALITFIANVSYASGKGTQSNPYTIK